MVIVRAVPAPGDLVAFDVDGTLVEHPEGKVVWQLLNRRFCGSDEVNQERYRQVAAAEMSYAEWVELDVRGWQDAGATRTQVFEAIAELTAVDGALEVLAELRQRGYRTALISGTLDVTVAHCLSGIEVDAIFLNRLHFGADDLISGWEATPYDREGKARCLAELAERHSLPLARCAFVGDHSNDVEAASAAGFSIAWNPRCPRLESVASVVLRGRDFRQILRYFPG